ncbi:MAG: HAMP domain-containing sensor histidine kinase [Oceanicaulis sp.]
MTALTARLARFADRNAGRAVHAGWLGVVASAGLAPAPSLGAAQLAWLALAALPGLAGLVWAGPERGRSDGARLIMALSWTLPGFAATAAFTTVISPAALVFLAGPAAMTAAGGRPDARLGSTVAACAFLLAAAAGLLGPAGPGATGLAAAPAPWVAFAAFLGAAGFFARARLGARLDAALEALRKARPAAEGFARAPSPLIALNTEGEIMAASRALRRVAPGAPRRLDGLPVDGLAFDEDQQAAVRAGLESARRGGAADGGRFSFTVRGANGAQNVLDARAVATPAGFVLSLDKPEAAARPANDHAEAEDAARLKAERDAAIAANRSKSEFLAAVSHELRTPLNAIIGFSDVMKQRLFGPLPARYAEYGDLIHESGTHLLELIGDVLDMSKIEADRYELSAEVFDARDIVEICAKMLRLRAEENGLALYADTGDAPLTVEADRKALRQILLNLLSNAVKFTPEGGAVVAMVRAQGPDLVLAVGDSGVGIAADELDKVGKPYAQSSAGRKTDERGTGLGLSLVRALAELHGGDMTVQSAPGEGTTVTVRLPVLVEAAGDIAPFEPLEVHQRIAAAQAAGAAISGQASA